MSFQTPGAGGKASYGAQAGQGGKGASQAGVGGKSGAASSGSTGKAATPTAGSNAPTATSGAQSPGLLSLINGLIGGGGNGHNPVATPQQPGTPSAIGTGSSPTLASPIMTAPGMRANPIQQPISAGGAQSPPVAGHGPTGGLLSPIAQGYQGARSFQQNPNEGGASSSLSSFTAPSATQGGMDEIF
jgi:hypothetical protein